MAIDRSFLRRFAFSPQLASTITNIQNEIKMNRIPRHTHSIQIVFSTRGHTLMRATFPFKYKSTFSVSEWYKRTKKAVSEGYDLPENLIKGSHTKIESTVFDRFLFEWPGGISIEVPDTVSAYDIKIILHYIDGIKMAKGWK